MKCEYCEREFENLLTEERFCCETHKVASDVLKTDRIMCCECGKISPSELQFRHLRKCCGLTVAQYREKHLHTRSYSCNERVSRGQKKRFANLDNLATHTLAMQECHSRPEDHDKRCLAQKISHNTTEYLAKAKVVAFESQNRPEVALKKSISTTITMNSPKMKLKMHEVALEVQNRPGMSDKKRASLREVWTEEKREEHSLTISEAMNRPEVVALMSEVMSVVMKRPEVKKNCSEATLRTIDEGKDPWYLNSITGYYRGVYFESSYEYRVMKAFDILKKEWRRAKLNIRYFDVDGKNPHNYRPDFIVNDNEIWETKGWNSDITQLKAEAARKFVLGSSGQYSVYRLLFNAEIVELEKEAARALSWSFEQYQEQVNKELLYLKSESDRKKSYHRQKVA